MSEFWAAYKDPRWQKRRLEIFTRDKFTCRKCGSKESTLHVHHTIYFKGRMPWDYEDKFLCTLCEDCHANITHLSKVSTHLFFLAWLKNNEGESLGTVTALSNVERFKNHPWVDPSDYYRGVLMVKMPNAPIGTIDDLMEVAHESDGELGTTYEICPTDLDKFVESKK